MIFLLNISHVSLPVHYKCHLPSSDFCNLLVLMNSKLTSLPSLCKGSPNSVAKCNFLNLLVRQAKNQLPIVMIITRTNKMHVLSICYILDILSRESQGWRSLVGCCLWGRTELDMTEAT